MKRRVETRDRGHVRQEPGYGVESLEGLRLVQGREVGERLQPPPHVAGDKHRPRIQRPAVHDAVADRVHRPGRLDRVRERRCLGSAAAQRGQVRGGCDGVVAGEHPQLEAARPGVDDEHAG
jgi:hypothetical protein